MLFPLASADRGGYHLRDMPLRLLALKAHIPPQNLPDVEVGDHGQSGQRIVSLLWRAVVEPPLVTVRYTLMLGPTRRIESNFEVSLTPEFVTEMVFPDSTLPAASTLQ